MLKDGPYRIAYIDSQNKWSVDFQYAYDRDWNKVWMAEWNDTDAQVVRVQTQTDGQEIYFPFSERAITDPTPASSRSEVKQAPRTLLNDPLNRVPEQGQRLEIVDTGETLTYDGTVYPLYQIKHHYYTGRYLVVGGYEPGEWSQWATKPRFLGWEKPASTSAQETKFIFIPREEILNGIYELRPKTDTRWAIAPPSNSSANGTQIYIESFKDANNQKWLFENDTQHGNEFHITNIQSDKLLTVNPISADSWTFPWLNDRLEGANYTQIFGAFSTATGVVNGDFVNEVMIGPIAEHNLRLDIAYTERTGNAINIGNQLMCGPISGSALQYWYIRRSDALDSNMPVPKVAGISPIYKGEHSAVIPRLDHEGKGKWNDYDYTKLGDDRPQYVGYLNFNAITGGDYQVRYRKRIRDWKGNWGDWGYWKDWVNDYQSFDGWGLVGVPNVSVTDAEYSKWVSQKWTDDENWVDVHDSTVYQHFVSCEEMQIQVRGLRNDYRGKYPAHSDWQTYTTKLMWEPLTFITGVKFTPKYGLIFEYSADWNIAGNGLHLIARRKNGRKVCDFKTELNLSAGNGQVIVPMKNLKWIPDFGEELDVEAYYTDCDATWEVKPATLGVEYQGDYSAPIQSWSEILNEQESYQANIKTPESKLIEVGCWIDVIKGHETHLEECFTNVIAEDGVTASVRVCPQYGRKSRIWYYALLENGKWSINGGYLDEINPYMAGCTLSWADEDNPYLMLAMDESAPELSRTYDTNNESYVTNGREHEIVKFGRTINSSFSLTAKIINDITFSEECELDAQSVFLADRLAYTRGATVIFRSYIGDWARVAITSLSVNRTSPDVNEVEVSMTEVSL